MVIKSRLGRLLRGKSRFRKVVTYATTSTMEDLPEVEVSSTSSGTGSHFDDNDTTLSIVPSSSSSTSSTTSTSSSASTSYSSSSAWSSPYGPDGDPYSDVRDKLEELSAVDRGRFVNGTHMDRRRNAEDEPEIPSLIAVTVYMSYAILIFIGHIRDFLSFITQSGRYIRRETGMPSDDRRLYAPLLKSWEHFYTRRLYTRVQDAFNRPIASSPGAHIQVLERVSDNYQKSMQNLGTLDQLDTDQQRDEYVQGDHFVLTSQGYVARSCLNLGSYNYLGFADDWHTTCAKEVKESLINFPVSSSSSRTEHGTTTIHRELERTVASFLNKEDALVLNMGFNTNATTLPALVGRGDLIISDELNHTSIVNGARASGAAIRIFRHGNMQDFESILRESIILGRPRTRRPWNKILVVVEGIYSMEGQYCDLKNIVRISKRYGAYVYLDEAHSIGALGVTGRGCAEHTGVDTADIDVMMGTFTKSFGAMGGYIAGNREIISYLRQHCAASTYHNAMSPVVCQQVLTAFKVITGLDGTNIGKQKLQALRDNANYFRMRLREMGLQVMGQYDSPIMPIMLYNPCKISSFSRECLKRGLAVVVVGFPAVSLLISRARFCISAGHTRADLDRALEALDEIADICNLRYAASPLG